MITDVIIIVLLCDIALTLRRHLHSTSKVRPITLTWLWPFDWHRLVTKSRRRR